MPQKLRFEGFRKDNMWGDKEAVDEETAQEIFRTTGEALNKLLEVLEMDFWSYFDDSLLVYLGDTATSRSNGIIVPGEKNFMKKSIDNSYSQEAANKHKQFFPVPRYAIYEELAHVLSHKAAEKEIDGSDFLQTIVLEACGGIGNAYASKLLLEDEINRCEAEIEEIARVSGEEQIKKIIDNREEILHLIEHVEKEVKHALDAESRDEIMKIREEIGQSVKKVVIDLSIGENPKKSLAYKFIQGEIFYNVETYYLNPMPNSGQVRNPETGKAISFEQAVEISLEILEEKKQEVRNLEPQHFEGMIDDWGQAKLRKEEPYFIGKSLAKKIVEDGREPEFIKMTGREIIDNFENFIQERRRFH